MNRLFNRTIPFVVGALFRRGDAAAVSAHADQRENGISDAPTERGGYIFPVAGVPMRLCGRGCRVYPIIMAILLAASLARTATVTWLPTGGTNDWFEGTNWSSGTWPTNAEDVVITNANVLVLLTNSTAPLASFLISNNCTLLFSNWNTALRATNVYLNGGTLTHTNSFATTTNGAGEWVPDARVWIVCSNLTIAAGAKIDVSDRGYLRGASQDGGGFGPGRGIHRGGCYGGFGTVLEHPSDSLSYGGVTNGDAADPWQPGSGGERWHSTAPGTHGGGAMRIEADGVVTVNGQILANAINGLGAPGSGGGIYIKCLRLDGTNGLIAANGGRSTSIGGYQTDGGGGRIAVIYTNSEQTASPGVRFSAVGGGGIFTYAQSSLGTLYFPDTKLLSETVADSMAGRLVIPGFTNWALNRLVVSNGWLGFSGTGFRLTVTNDITVIGRSVLSNQLEFDAGAAVTCGGDLLLTNAALALYAGTGVNAGATVNVGGNLTLAGTNSALYLYNGETNTPGIPVWSAAINVTGDVTIVSNTWIHAFSHRTNGGSARFSMRSLDIAAGGGINANGRGYGRGGSTGSGPGWTSPDGRGAGHGGRGGGSSPGGGSTYGNSNAPIAAGSSGHRQSSSLVGTGGGVIRIEAAQNVRVDGSLLANGRNATGNIGGGGAGGSIYVVCRRFRGAGTLEAPGGDGTSSGGGGGGGRIAVWRIYHESTVSTDVTAGSYGTVAAEAGTVVWGLFPVPGTIFTMH